jgi:hypothetical protein
LEAAACAFQFDGKEMCLGSPVSISGM